MACPYCRKRFKSVGSTNKHIGKSHDGEPLILPKRFVPVYDLK